MHGSEYVEWTKYYLHVLGSMRFLQMPDELFNHSTALSSFALLA